MIVKQERAKMRRFLVDDNASSAHTLFQDCCLALTASAAYVSSMCDIRETQSGSDKITEPKFIYQLLIKE